jgi:GH35 family endo-1,4-beta-xylanase
MAGSVIFKPYFVQKGRGPHMNNFAMTFDQHADVFYSKITIKDEGVSVKDLERDKKFGIILRWNVEGYGFLFMPADNGGEFYQLPSSGNLKLNLNFELANTRVYRNRLRRDKFTLEKWIPSRDIQTYIDFSEEYLRDARRTRDNPEKCAGYSQEALKYALLASEMIEIEKARYDISKQMPRDDFLFGCDARGYFQMDKQLFMERFTEMFNYSTITHYLIGDTIDFEPKEGQKNYRERDEVLEKMLENGITVEGRPLYWTHTWVTPDWLKAKSYPEVLTYVENHVREVVSHYGNKIRVWEVVNELHDWAMEVELNHEQTIELTKLACEVARDTNPDVQLLINNCCPFADYVQQRKWHERDAKFPQRTPHQFTKELIEAGVDFDIIGVQVYFVKRTLTDALQSIERYQHMGKKVQLAEIGAPSRGITQEFIDEDREFSSVPYEWHRHWDEELQADWLEYVFTYAYSKPFIEAANWYDLVDPFGFLKYGGILRSSEGEKKAAVDRLLKLKEQLDDRL